MNREIKYRAWNKKKGIMNYDNEDGTEDYWDGIYTSEIGMVNRLLNIPDKDDHDSISSFRNKYEVMQYTGLKDKNGVEIYEGDIIKTTLGGSVLAVKIGECFPEPVKKYCLHYGIKKHTVYCLYAYDKQGEYLFEDNRAFEVIGNIHDNPELLENE